MASKSIFMRLFWGEPFVPELADKPEGMYLREIELLGA